MAREVMTVGADEAVVFDGAEVFHYTELSPDTHYDKDGAAWRTLPLPGGERLATVATVNDTHFGEVECGLAEIDIGPVLSSAPGEDPYPEVMNRAAAAEIAALAPDAVVAKGDLTGVGDPAEYARFEACYRPLLGDRLYVTRGNHDHRPTHTAFTCAPTQEVVLPGVVLAILDTTRPEGGGGTLSPSQLEWLDELAARADRPVTVFGHHPAWAQAEMRWSTKRDAIDPDSSAALTGIVARRPRIVGYFCGHTHRNRVQRFADSGDGVWVEVACVKDFPGSWAEYQVYEGGLLQLHRRISAPDALAWSERCRTMFGGYYPEYALGSLEDRCFSLGWR